MKKIALLPAIALLMLGACSDKDEPNPIPTDPVVSVQPVADNVTLVSPEQNNEYEREPQYGSASYRFTYTNGQEIIFEVLTDGTQYFAIARKLEGSSSEVIIPTKIRARLNGELTDIPVAGLDLFVDAASDNVKTVGISGSAHYMVITSNNVNTLSVATPNHIRNQVSKCPKVEKFILDSSYPGYTSMDGVIYTSDFSALVAVPMGYKGYFTVAEGTQEVQDRAMFKCNNINAITFPASVKVIGHEAVVSTNNLALINILSEEAPIAYEDSFGYYAFNALVRIPEGSISNYIFTKPDLTEPIEPTMPTPDSTEEEWNKYDNDMDQYYNDLEAYNEAMKVWNEHAAYASFTRIEQVNFK